MESTPNNPPVRGRARGSSRGPADLPPVTPSPPLPETMAAQEQEGAVQLAEDRYRYVFEEDHHPLTLRSMLGGGGAVAQGRGSGLVGDQRALQIALELSKMGMVDSSSSLMAGASATSPDSHRSFMQQAIANGIIPPDSMVPQASSFMYGMSYLNFGNEFGYLMQKKSQNMTECVPVPSCEHVAEIVGRQGCKIKTLRAKTNTYIKTPVRGEEPVFVVTGRKEDVSAAKSEILNAAEHFSQIRASRGLVNGNAPPAVPGQITVQIRVPYRVVGLVVGPKGATIKRIQQLTHTYIVTPSRDKDPVFEVTGMPEHVELAKTEIESHIAIRTGSLPMDDQSQALDQDDQTSSSDLLASLYKNGLTGLGGFGGLERIGIGLGAINSLPCSLSGSVTDLMMAAQNGLGSGGALNNGVSASSSISGGGSLPSLSSLNGFTSGMAPGAIGRPTSVANRHQDTHMYTQLSDLGFSFLDTTAGKNGCMSSSNSDDSYLFGGSGPNSIGGSQTKLSELFAAIGTSNAVSFSSSLWGAFDRDEGLGESPTPETSSPGASFM